MAQTGARNDPFVTFRFEVKLDGIASAGFAECNGLQLETEFLDYMEGGVNDYVHKRPTRTKQGNLTLKRGIVDRQLWDWYYDLTQGTVAPKNGEIVVRDPSGGTVVMAWNIENVLPVKWLGSDLNAGQNNIAIETLELSYLRLKRGT
jgi:phage tail-like protein